MAATFFVKKTTLAHPSRTGVGSVVGLNNADVASLLGLDVLLVANGGLGSTYDVLTLNRNLCNATGVRVRAVLLNKVRR